MSENEKLERKDVSAETCLGCASVNTRDKQCRHEGRFTTPYEARRPYNVYTYSKDALGLPVFSRNAEGMAADTPGRCPLYRRAGT